MLSVSDIKRVLTRIIRAQDELAFLDGTLAPYLSPTTVKALDKALKLSSALRYKLDNLSDFREPMTDYQQQRLAEKITKAQAALNALASNLWKITRYLHKDIGKGLAEAESNLEVARILATR